MAWLALLLQVLPYLTGLLTVIGAANGLNSGNVAVTYGASALDASAIWSTIIPLLGAAATHGGTALLRNWVAQRSGSTTAGALIEITAILGMYEIGLKSCDQKFQTTVSNLAHQWVDVTFKPVDKAST